MKKVIFKTVEFLTGAKVHATHTAIKGKKSSGSQDLGGHGDHWKQGSDTQ
jgi:hypothetical protein